MDDATKAWLENKKVICQCLGIKKKFFLDVIAEGADTIEEVYRRTGAGRGSCGGKRCAEKIEAILAESRANRAKED